MNPLITMQARPIGGIQQPTVNARELWQFVESRRDFLPWMQYRIQKFGLVENEDYVFDVDVENPLGGRPRTDYHLTIDTAKEMGMVEANAKGREIRRYFIECERLAKEAHARQVQQGDALSPRMQRFIQARPLPRLDRYQNSVINRKAASMGRQMTEINRDYLLHELAGLINTGDGRSTAIDDHTLDYLIHMAQVDEAFAFGYARERARQLAQIAAYRQLLG
jgi:phage anti-repressor protein